jgi:DNA-binding CsgD family transcriptional regulator
VQEAGAAYRVVEQELARFGVSDPDLSPVPELVECGRRAGTAGSSLTTARAYLEAASGKGQPWALARAHRAVALALVDERAEVEFRTALALHARTPDAYETARTQLAWGAYLRRAKRRTQARPALRQALATFEQLGAAPWAERAAAELAATGETAVRRGSPAVTALTPQERQIAGLLATGRTTREAAAALFLSPKTVEYHLRHVYLKLGIRSRDELTRVMAGD